MEIIEEDATYTSSDGTKLHAFIVRPQEDKRYPGIIIIHEIWGLNDQIRGVARRYAQQEYVALAPNLFDRHSEILTEQHIKRAMIPFFSLPREKRSDPSALQGLMETMSEADRQVVQILFAGRQSLEKLVVEDVTSGYQYLCNLSFMRENRIGVTGFCFGGGLAFQLSTLLPFSASVIFYGSNPKPLESVSKIKGPVLAFYAGEDEMVDAGITDLVKVMIKYKKTFAMKLYKGVQHAFFNETSSVYDRDAAEDAWQIALAFFNKYLQV